MTMKYLVKVCESVFLFVTIFGKNTAILVQKLGLKKMSKSVSGYSMTKKVLTAIKLGGLNGKKKNFFCGFLNSEECFKKNETPC